MGRRRAFRAASWVALVAWVGTLLSAVTIAAFGVIGLAGWDDYRYRAEAPIPGLSLSIGFQPSWSVSQADEVCPQIDLSEPETDCYGLILKRGEPQEDGGVLTHRDGEVRAVAAGLSGRILLEAEPGWNPLMASLYGMQVLTLLVLTLLLAQLWLLLRTASRGSAFTGQMVRRLRFMGWTMVGWEVVEPLLWLLNSPKAHGYSALTAGPWPHLELGSMEPGGPDVGLVAFGLLLVLLAEIFRHGSDLSDEQRLTV